MNQESDDDGHLALSSSYAPIALFAYRRTELLKRTLDSLEICPEFSLSDVFVYSDGPKTLADVADVDAVRAFVRSRLARNIRLIEAPVNKGLARSIIDGATQLCEQYGRVIVIEDDLIVSPVVLSWFNAALGRYANEPSVMQISGHVFESPALRDRREGFFLPLTTSWGWATWKRAWAHFDPEASGWETLKTDRKSRRRFDIDGSFPYMRMLRRQMAGKIDSWAIRWYWAVFKVDGLTLFPPQTLVINAGDDVKASHGGMGGIRRTLQQSMTLPSVLADLPDTVCLDRDAFAAVRESVARSRSIIRFFFKRGRAEKNHG